MKKCTRCGDIHPELQSTRRRVCNDCINGRHGLKASEIIELAQKQGWKCAVTDKPLGLCIKKPWKVVDLSTRSKKAVAIDHCHNTKKIRGLLAEKANWLVDEFEKGSYGTLSEPTKIKDYKANPPAINVFGIRYWK